MILQHIRTLSGKGHGPAEFRVRLAGIAVDPEDRLLAVGDREVKRFATEGTLDDRFPTRDAGWSISVDDATIWVGMQGAIVWEGVAGLRDLQDQAGLEELAIGQAVDRQQFGWVDVETAGDAVGVFPWLQGVGGWSADDLGDRRAGGDPPHRDTRAFSDRGARRRAVGAPGGARPGARGSRRRSSGERRDRARHLIVEQRHTAGRDRRLPNGDVEPRSDPLQWPGEFI